MKFLLSLILLGLSGSAIAGGDTVCGPLQAKYLGLLQACEYFIDESLNIVNLTVDSYVLNGFINYFLCNLDLTIDTMSKATSQFSGISFNYIRKIFDGSVRPPFVYPLDCIESEMMSFNLYVQNILNNIIPEFKKQIIKSPINETTPCPTVIQIQSQSLANGNAISSREVNITIATSAIFASLGLSNLFIEQNNISHPLCGAQLVIENFAEFYNMNTTIISEFIQNTSISVPQPLSCTKNLIVSIIQGFNYSVANMDSKINSSANTSQPPDCEPLFSDFKAFKYIWFQYIDQLRFNTLNISVANPILTPFFVADLLCEFDLMMIFAANATSSLSGVDSDIIYGILNGQVSTPFPLPLDCIANDLIFMRNQINILFNDVFPGFQNFAITSTSDTSTCNATYTSLTTYVVQLADLLNMKGYSVSSGIALFASTNFNDMYLESFTLIIDCLPGLVGKYVGAALNANGNAVTAYVKGNRKSLPYPFRCARILIDIIDSLLNQALVNFVTESPNNLVLPKIPKYRGK